MNLKEMQEKICEILPAKCEVTSVELEGPEVVVYLKHMKHFYEHENLVSALASAVRRKVILRVDPSRLRPIEESEKKIRELIPEEAGITSINFDPVFSEVLVESVKPGIVIGKMGSILKSIVLETGWTPKVLRAPTSPSETEEIIRNMLLKEAPERKKFFESLGKSILSKGSTGGLDWVKLTALGGAKEVGRSCFLVQTSNSNILIDCGVNTDNSVPTKAYPYLNAMNLPLEELDAVIVSHSHLDHSGFVPYLFAYGYDGPVYCTPPTRDLMVLLQRDYLNVTVAEGKKPPYHEKDIKKQLLHTITRKYGEVTDITPEIRFTFQDAGHILGSCSVHLHFGEGKYNLVYSGDINYAKSNLLDQASAHFPRTDALIIESTYGGRGDIQQNPLESEKKLMEIVDKAVKRKGKVLIPVFSVGRAQEIMLVLEKNWKYGEDVPVYLDGMSREGCAIHTVYPEYLKKSVRTRILTNDSPFDKPFFKRVTSKERNLVVEDERPAVILAPSGMLTGGPSVYFLQKLCDDPKNALIFVGYQGAMTLGRKIQEGQREVPFLNEETKKLDSLKINLEVQTCEGFSGHSDRNQLMSFAHAIRPRPQKVFCVHGDGKKCDDLAKALGNTLKCESRVLMDLDSVRLI